jgi:hypothetical protein
MLKNVITGVGVALSFVAVDQDLRHVEIGFNELRIVSQH